VRTKDAILQDLAIEQARFAELERAREEARTKIVAWQLRTQARELTANTLTPPLPAGTSRLTGCQQALVEFLRIDTA
jgi:hypothetical protein